MNAFCEPNGQEHGPGHWLSGSLRRKLTLFVVMILLMVVGLFWFFTVFMLQPAYQRSIKNDLEQALSTVAGVLDEMESEGIAVVVAEPLTSGYMLVRLSDGVIERLNNALQSGGLNMNNRCLDIADTSLQNLLLVDGLESTCVLHPMHEGELTAEGPQVVSEYNGETVMRLRSEVFQNGSIEMVHSGQIVMGRTAANGKLSVILSANLERIPQAVSVLKQLMLPLSVLLTLFAMLAAWAFSRWFTRPLTRLSAAAKELGKGNYSVRVEDCGDDEIGDLARDFNSMAREVERSASLQRDIMANVSHDLRTPLTLIKGYAETVRDLTGDDVEKRTEQLNVIVDETDRLSKLVGSVLELSRVSAGTEKPDMVRFDLSDLCEEVAYRYEIYAKQKGYHFEFSGEEGCQVLADAKQLERALDNLLGNALNHVGEDGYIGLKVFKTGFGTVRVEVSDHGQGIDPQDMPRIFDRYYRSRVDTGKPGTGLGLSITKAIFTAHGFNYGAESTVGEGATFWFEALLVK